MPRLAALLFTALALAACAPEEAQRAEAPEAAEATKIDPQFIGQTGESPILNTVGEPIGTATLTEGPAGVLLRLRFEAGALSPGWHGVHFHQVGGCDDGPAGFTHSASHIGAAGGRHGLLNPNGPEAGDLPSIWAPASGAFETELYSPFLTFGAHVTEDRTAIYDADGASLIIHAARDDQSTQPIGGAGDRVACAVFTAG